MASDTNSLRYLIDSYRDWMAREGIPVVEGIAVDLNGVETAPWPRLGTGVRGAFVQLRGRGDFVGLHVIDIPPGGATDWAHRLFDEVFYVLSGHGSAVVDAGEGQRHGFEWGARALFSAPLNTPYRLFNTSGTEAVRIVSANDLPFMLNVYRNERFLFDNKFAFPERLGRKGYFAGEGDFLPVRPGKHMWETNFVPDLGLLSLPEWEARGAGSHNMKLKQAPDASIQEGGAQINYEDQDPRIHSIWLSELAKTGITSRMGKHFDEERIREGR